MKIVRLVLLVTCVVAPVACIDGSITHPDAPPSVAPAGAPLGSESADSTARDGSHTFGSGH